ncbi:hypothetical protein Xoosp14_73 [Xanthomonas phage Xoo-sp14]|nr:hypothetical protein Xoosp14_73 [Xanthomonas phage Xoo-sp14]
MTDNNPKSPNLTAEEKERVLQRARNDPKFFIENILKDDPDKANLLMNSARVLGIADKIEDLPIGPVIFMPRMTIPRHTHRGVLLQAIQRNLAMREVVTEHLRTFMAPALKAYKARDKIRARRRIKRRGRKY